MIIDVRKLNAQKQYHGSMEFSYSAPDNLIAIPYVKFAGPVEVRFEFELYEDDALEIKGTVKYVLEGQCSRCLKDARQEVIGELDALFEPSDNAEDYSYTRGVILLNQAVDESISASMPYILSCGEGCVALRYSDEPTTKR
ncbi:MAG: hypothetical protein IJ996_05685 [Clostridia bacterium]|nr:hypothetical protein [Clostridia bacterium]